MINFASLFSQFRGGSTSPINDLLDQPDTDIDRLLDEDSFPNEYKSGNSKVMSYLKYDKMEALIQYVTVVGPAQDKKKGYKFPLAACDILSSDNSSTIDFFFPNGALYTEENIEEEVQVEEEQQIDDEKPSQEQDPENTRKTVIEDQLENEDQPEHLTNQKSDEEKMDIEEIKQIKKKTILVKKKKIINKVIKKQVVPLIDKLFSYFEGEVNYTLAGYVSKILLSFFGKKPIQTMKYVLQPNNFEKALNHVESRSVGEFITKIMTHQSTELLAERVQALKKIIQKLSKNDEIFVICNLSLCICDIIEKVTTNAKSTNAIPQYCGIFFSPKIVISIINNVISEEQNISVYNSPILLTFLANAPIVLPENQTIINEFKSLLTSFVEKSIQKLSVTKNQRQTLGFGRVKIVQILSHIIKENLLISREIVARQGQFFPTFINLLKNYQMNNILHNQFMKIVIVALNEKQQSPLLNNLLQGDYFLNFLSEEAQEDHKIRTSSKKQKNRKGYIGHIIEICRKIQENSIQNEKINLLAQKSEFQNIIQSLVNKDVYEYNKTLAGFSLKKGPSQTIMFMKEEVLKEHIKFLAASPPPVFQPEPENINIQHPILEQSHKASISDVMEALQTKDELKEEQQNSDQQLNPKYWIKHMDYELDELLDDL